MSDVAALMKEHAARVDARLRDAVARHTTNAPPRLVESILYSLTAGGKRLRPALVLETARACGGSPDDQSALAAAVAIELIHTFSLVHDDLPAMDDDDLRRGVPTNHVVFGEAMAILAGDAMVTLAFETIASDADAALMPALVRELASAAGPIGMIGGQVLDMEGEKRKLELPELAHVHRMKTAALLIAACRMGAVAARAPEAHLDRIFYYGLSLGLAFQIVDDVLDVTATPAQLGKHTNKDADRGKNTYPGLLGVEMSRAIAQQHVATAVSALDELGPSADGLRAIARFVTARST